MNIAKKAVKYQSINNKVNLISIYYGWDGYPGPLVPAYFFGPGPAIFEN